MKREGVTETEGEVQALARYNHVADLLTRAEADGGDLVVRMPAPLAAVAMPRYTALRGQTNPLGQTKSHTRGGCKPHEANKKRRPAPPASVDPGSATPT